MQTHDLIQGSADWHTYRANHFNASDAPAMMGVSPYKTRSELIHERATGIIKEVDVATQARFDDGHRFEALARPLAEKIIDQDLYPVTGSLGELSASFDGITMDERIIWEHKSLNGDIRAAQAVADLGLHYHVQMEQQLLVAGAEKVLFMASKWDDDGNLVEERHFWYEPDPALRERIIAGWGQFAEDVAAYQPRAIADKPAADAIIALPALVANIRGEVVATNLPTFKAAAEQFIAKIKTDLKTDEDFANAEATVKFCDAAEKDLERAKAAVIAQTATIDGLMRTVDHIKEQLRSKRLMLEKLVKTKKEQIKESILKEAKLAYAEHVVNLESEIAPICLTLPEPDFAGAMKNKRTLASLHDAVDTLLASAKIAANEAAAGIRAKLAWHKQNAEGYATLFPDLRQIIGKPMDDFQLIVTTRITDHKKAEEERRSREQAKAEAEAVLQASPSPAEPRRAQLQASADLFLAHGRERADDERKTGLPAGSLRTVEIEGPDDDEIIDTVAATFNLSRADAIERLATIDFARARGLVAA
jgi:putative phage-type endonuclease